MRYADRFQAGRVLGTLLSRYRGRPDVRVCSLPGGGVPVAAEVARALEVPLILVPVVRLALPGRAELTVGAVAPCGAMVVDREAVDELALPPEELEAALAGQLRALRRFEGAAAWPPRTLEGASAILVDEGLFCSAGMRAAVLAVRTGGVERVVIAVPAAVNRALQALSDEVDEVVCPLSPPAFFSLNDWYLDARMPTENELARLLAERGAQHPAPA